MGSVHGISRYSSFLKRLFALVSAYIFPKMGEELESRDEGVLCEGGVESVDILVVNGGGDLVLGIRVNSSELNECSLCLLVNIDGFLYRKEISEYDSIWRFR